ncbi:hypothetical protein LWI29_010650 [Acer saccharum]|uniref:Uncharacterized protein n=1 Tax=Acer saccharum TaxID=4024 RepID=A0AA39VHY7_ACESA|nr:hypothetical protein LWI29_010650 [Acer saccharum]
MESQNLQWAQDKAGEDRVHVVVSEEHGWVFVGIYNGFNSLDALDFLLSNLYSAVHKEVKGLLWDDKFESNSTTENPSAVVETENPSRIDVTEADTCLQCVDLDLDLDSVIGSSTELEASTHGNIRELHARLQIGHLKAKHRALDNLVEVMKEDEKNLLAVLGRSNIAALVQLLTATSPCIREETVTVICSFAESGSCENWLVSEGVLPPLIRLVESGSAVGKGKATISLQILSMSAETARAMVGHSGVRPFIEICQTGDFVTQAAAACTLKNISAVPEVRQTLAEEGIVKVMISLLDCGILLGSKEYAAECLQNLIASNESLRRSVVSEGGTRSLLAYLDSPLPQESAVTALRNLVGSVSVEVLLSLSFLPRLVHVLKAGSLGAQQAAASAICKVCSPAEIKKLVGEAGCIPLLVKMLEAKSNSAREVVAQAISSLVTISQNCREVKRDDKSVPNLVQLLDPSPQNTAKKYAVSCLASLSSSKKCKKLMISYGAIGYLKKLSEMDIPGAKKLLERLERGKLRSLFSRK